MTDEPHTSAALTRHVEELGIGTYMIDAGTARAEKVVTSEHVTVPTTRQVEHLDDFQRVAANDQDSGQIETLDDG